MPNQKTLVSLRHRHALSTGNRSFKANSLSCQAPVPAIRFDGKRGELRTRQALIGWSGIYEVESRSLPFENELPRALVVGSFGSSHPQWESRPVASSVRL